MEEIGRLRNSLIQEEVLSHISSRGQKFEKLNFKMVQQFARDRVKKYRENLLRIERNRRVKKNWSDEDLKILVWVVAKYCEWKSIRDVYYDIVTYT